MLFAPSALSFPRHDYKMRVYRSRRTTITEAHACRRSFELSLGEIPATFAPNQLYFGNSCASLLGEPGHRTWHEFRSWVCVCGALTRRRGLRLRDVVQTVLPERWVLLVQVACVSCQTASSAARGFGAWLAQASCPRLTLLLKHSAVRQEQPAAASGRGFCHTHRMQDPNNHNRQSLLEPNACGLPQRP